MQANKANDEEVRQLIKDRMDECGITVIDIAEQNPYLADRIKRGIVDDSTVFACTQVLGLITHHKLYQIPSRDDLITLLRYGKSSYPCQDRLVDWGCNGEHLQPHGMSQFGTGY